MKRTVFLLILLFLTISVTSEDVTKNETLDKYSNDIEEIQQNINDANSNLNDIDAALSDKKRLAKIIKEIKKQHKNGSTD